jgi:hypothetical protein
LEFWGAQKRGYDHPWGLGKHPGVV